MKRKVVSHEVLYHLRFIGSRQCVQYYNLGEMSSDLVGLAAIWRGWLDPICIGAPEAPVLYPIRRRLRRKD